MMRRVSSRQRLVSWDAFDATVMESDEEQDYVTCYEASLSQQSSFALEESLLDDSIRGAVPISPVSRKRDRSSSEPCGTHKSVSFSNLQAPAVIEALTCELEGPLKGTTMLDSLIEKQSFQFEDLMDDVKLHMFSFLSVPEARTMSTVNKHYRQLLHSPAAVSLWTDWIHRRWPLLSHPKNFVDLLQMPTAVCNCAGINFSVLLGHAARHQPTGVDKALLTPPPVRRLRSFREESLPKRTIFRTLDGSVQYTGPVGTGDRCIRGDQPLAGPYRLGLRSPFANKPSLLDFLCRGSRAVTGTVPPWRPFVAPYVTKTEVHMTPRLVSYYEVSILPCPEDFEFERNVPHPRASDCVAIGVATSTFNVRSRMPGWDISSYGYHGDDGGIFHGSGDMMRRFGPSFGVGDTVGCGIDYIARGIFFTLNGELLGYGWTNIDLEFLQQDLYPTVGVDTNFPVECNFGERPFCYDLTSMVERHKHVVQACLSGNRDMPTV